ncbi:hypothetical protein DFJ58DRAFT_767621 [Suillus subalutaceus]|uniref:uncharacterized protein n=1 Tax=Suillus subalutaceus TaxID=48586 RepID=UPI001B86777C|nr:uncharacterized protein DFJ58DRAFT_767621 [Suillus subalutaceus]KAG1868363.1 hypothetical protein DFJ58DRAFT_767621 [Suillus subalutaceus]
MCLFLNFTLRVPLVGLVPAGEPVQLESPAQCLVAPRYIPGIVEHSPYHFPYAGRALVCQCCSFSSLTRWGSGHLASPT